MKTILCFSVLVCVVNCINNELVTRSRYLPDDQESLGIYGGKKVSIKKAPYTVALLRMGTSHCAGAILNKKWIATSGECADEYAPSELTIVAGSNDGVNGEKFKVDKVITHPKFSSSEMDYDIALIRIASEFKWSPKVKPVNLPSTSPEQNTKVIASGYGDTKAEELDGTNGHLMAGVLYWQSTDSCKKAYSGFSFKWTPRMACAYNQGKTTLCDGDWADPLVCNNTLHGLYIACAEAEFCTSRSKPVILTRIYAVAEWISNTIAA